MVEQPALARAKSVVPCSCTNTESAVLPASLESVWTRFRYWKLEELAPSIVQSSEWTDGDAGRVDSTVKLTYVNGAAWYLRVTELSERNHTLGYELIMAEPATEVTSIVGSISLEKVTDEDQTFIRWETEYSNDVDNEFVGDARWKKRDFFAAVKATLSTN